VTGRVGDRARGGPVQTFYLPPGAARRPVIARAKGIYLWDRDGRRYLDGSSGPVVSTRPGRQPGNVPRVRVGSR
jgi:4-aminobutyrate aminotransferase-like enzyme